MPCLVSHWIIFQVILSYKPAVCKPSRVQSSLVFFFLMLDFTQSIKSIKNRLEDPFKGCNQQLVCCSPAPDGYRWPTTDREIAVTQIIVVMEPAYFPRLHGLAVRTLHAVESIFSGLSWIKRSTDEKPLIIMLQLIDE